MTFVAEMLVPWTDGLALIAQGDYAGDTPAAVGSRRACGRRTHTVLCNVVLGTALVGLKRFDEAGGLLEESLS
jgi:hypothetical protein